MEGDAMNQHDNIPNLGDEMLNADDNLFEMDEKKHEGPKSDYDFDDTDTLIDYNYPREKIPKIIKVVGVGGAGGNAVKNLHSSGFTEVSYLLCNTDYQVLRKNPVENKLVLGRNLTNGYGAGDDPEVARQAAEESADEIRKILDDGHTRMVFITAGMGKGTGTGASPVVARIAKELNLLTVGIVTIPFVYEGRVKILKALKGVEALKEHVDALMIINNERIRSLYGELDNFQALEKADETLANAARGIADLVVIEGVQNLDFNDVRKTLRNGGIAIINSGIGEGEDRMRKAIDAALNSPLLNDNDISNAKEILVNIYQSMEYPLSTDEQFNALTDLSRQIKTDYELRTGNVIDPSLGKKVKVTILGSGFDIETTKRSLGMGDDPLNEEGTHISREEAERIREQNEALLNTYYKKDELEGANTFPTFKPILLGPDEFDNEELISAMEEPPAATRSSSVYARITDIRQRIKDSNNQKAKSDLPINEEIDFKPEEEKPEASDNVILF